MSLWQRWVLLTLIGSLLAACGGGGGSSGNGGGNNGTSNGFTAKVAPAGSGSSVSKADVLLVRTSSAATRSTGSPALLEGAEILQIGAPVGNGRYRFSLPSGNRNNLVVLAQQIVGGAVSVGSTVELYAPLNLIESGELTVSPVTTLALLRARSGDSASLQTAMEAILVALGVEDASDPVASLPLLSALSLGDYLDGWAQSLANDVSNLEGMLVGLDLTQAPEIYQQELSLRRDVALGILSASENLAGDVLVSRFNEIEFQARAAAILDTAGAAYNDAVLTELAEKVVANLDGVGIGGGNGAGNILRYLINTYQLTDSLQNEALSEQEAQQILTDGNLPRLAASSNAVPVSLPLLEGELLGMDSERRRLYYLQTNAAPGSVVANLFASVTDANVTDQVQGAVAVAAANQGQVDVAEFVARSQVFGTVVQAEAYADAGQALLELGDISNAGDFLTESLDIYLSFIDTKGEGQIDEDDITFLQGLIGSAPDRGLVGLGNNDAVARATAPLDTFFDLYGAGNYNAGLGRAITAYWRAAEDQVEQALASNLNNESLNNAAQASVDQLAEVVRTVDAAQTTSSSICTAHGAGGDTEYVLRALYMQRAIGFYEQLQLKEKALEVINNDLPLVRTSDYASCWAERYFDKIAVSLIKLGAQEEADALLATMVDSDEKEDAEQALVLVNAELLREEGKIQDAVDVILAETDVEDTLLELLYYNSLPDQRKLAGNLVDKGRFTEAKVAIDAAWAYFQGDKYQAHIEESGAEAYNSTYFLLAAGRIAELYHRAGYNTEANEVLAYLADAVENEFTINTNQQVIGQFELARAYQAGGQENDAIQSVLASRASALTLPLGSYERVERLSDVLSFQMELGEFGGNGYFQTLTELQNSIDALCCAGVPADGLAEAADDKAAYYWRLQDDAVEASQRLREKVWRAQAAGESTTLLQTQLDDALEQAFAIALQAVEAAFSQADPEDTVSSLNIVFAAMAHLDMREEVMEAAARIETTADRNAVLVNAARAWLRAKPYQEFSDLPTFMISTHYPLNTTQVITEAPGTVDSDNDGLPDFYSLAATADQRVLLPLDPDIDGDGINDTTDRYPLDPQQ